MARQPGWGSSTAALLVALLPAFAQASSGLGPGPESGTPPPWLRLAVDPSHPKLQQAARAALHYFNYRSASPSTFRTLKEVLGGTVWVNGKKGEKYELEFTVDNYKPGSNEERLGTCSALVIFKDQKPKPAVNITCTRILSEKEREKEDYELYKQMKQLKKNPGGIKIPDVFGYVDPSLQPLWHLAMIGSSYVMWEKTSKSLYYYLTQLNGVKQWVTSGNLIIFNYSILLHEFSTQEIILCRIHLLWYPSKPLKIWSFCPEPLTPGEGSGNSEASAETPTEILSNF
ncbi:retinoic acid receptor responder protein 1 [Macrotis lagotis]|uniref:retinoic acid receptor responder protein 1 n=1 Tax=Macrotis lagotis TaxID=92651 RepID=UPI003D694F4F